MSRLLDDLPRLPLEQNEIASSFLRLAQHLLTILSRGGRLPAPPRDAWQPSLAAMEGMTNLQLKTVEAPVSRALSWILEQVGDDPKLRARTAEQIEQLFKAARLTTAGSAWLNQTFAPLLPKKPDSIWLAGCGEGFEVRWLRESFPAAHLTLIDIDDEALKVAKATVADHKINNCDVIRADLTNREDLPAQAPDVVLYLHPFVIEHEIYNRTALAIVQKKRPAEISAIAESVQASVQGMRTLHVLKDALAEGGRLLVATLDGLETLAILRDGPAGGTAYKNPFPIKIVSSLLVEKRHPPILAPRNFQYIHCWSAG